MDENHARHAQQRGRLVLMEQSQTRRLRSLILIVAYRYRSQSKSDLILEGILRVEKTLQDMNLRNVSDPLDYQAMAMAQS